MTLHGMNVNQAANQAGNPERPDAPDYDVVVVGGGAAGLSAALVLGRARRRVVVVDAGSPRNAPAAHMQGFLGSDGLPPAELLARGREEIAGYGVQLVRGTVTELGPQGSAGARRWFRVDLEDGSSLQARRVLVTTGLRDRIPDVLSASGRWGRDLLHCPYCHGHEVRDQPLGVVATGTGSRAVAEAAAHAQLIRQWSDDVVLFTHGADVTADQGERLLARGIGIVAAPVVGLRVEDDRLTGVEVADGLVVPRSAVFVRPEFVPHDTLLTDLGCAVDDHGWVVVDAVGATSVAGVWAAGNAVNPRAQVITAAGEGSAAAIALNNDLVDEDQLIAVAAVRRDLTA